MSSTYAVLIAIEKYQQPGISSVEYAAADAQAFRAVLLERFNVPAANISLWIGQDATQNRLLNDLPYTVRQLGPDDRFIFFYAGHGFFANGSNRLTTWDSHPGNLEGTTTCLEKALLDPLKKSQCRSSIVFIDACAASLKEHATFSRDILSDMTPAEFEALIRSSNYSAVFFSCSPLEKSYSSPVLGHGIWTYHLLMALRGEVEDAIQRDRSITGDSLKNYLSVAVPKYIREKTSMRGLQRPFAIVGSNGAFEVIRIPERDAPSTPLPYITFEFNGTAFRGIEIREFSGLEGFNRKLGHRVPESVNSSAAAWGKRLLNTEIVAELEKTKDNAKEILGLGRRDVNLSVDGEAGGSLDTDQFRFSISSDQNNDDPSTMVITRRVTLRVAVDKLPSDFDDIFEGKLNEMIIPVSFKGERYDDIADALERFAKANNARFAEISSEGVITVTFPNTGPTVVFDSSQDEVRFSGPGARGCLALVGLLKANTVSLLVGNTPLLLGAAPQSKPGK